MRRIAITILVFLLICPLTWGELEISGIKTFLFKDNWVEGDLNHYVRKNFDAIPGFAFEQTLRLDINGNLMDNVFIKASLDDTSFEEKELTITIDGKIWDITLGDFLVDFADQEYSIYNKKLKGFRFDGNFNNGWTVMGLFSRVRGKSTLYRSEGKGLQQKYQLPFEHLPIVENSEKVYVDNVLKLRGQDYYLDYEIGIVQFKPERLPIESDSIVLVEYEYQGDATFKRSLYGVSGGYRYNNDNHINLSVFRDAEDPDSYDGEITDTTPLPIGQTVYDFTGKFNLSNYFKGIVEVARSVKDLNLFSSDDSEIYGTASRMLMDYLSPKVNVHLSQRRVEPTFTSVGKEKFVFLDRSDKVGDVNEVSGRVHFIPWKQLTLDLSLGDAYTNIQNLPGRNRTRYKNQSFAGRYDYRNNSYMESTYQMDDRNTDDRSIEFQRILKSVGWGHAFSPKYSVKMRFLEDGQDSMVNTAGNYEKQDFSLNFNGEVNSAVKFALGYNIIDNQRGENLDPEKRVDNLSANLSLNYGRNFNILGVFIKRREKDLILNNVQDTNTADLRMRLVPFPWMNTSVKYREVQTSKTLIDPEEEEKMQQDPNYRILPEYNAKPVTNRTGSVTMDLGRSSKMSSNFYYRFNSLEDLIEKKKFSWNQSMNLKLKYSPFRNLSNILDLGINDSDNILYSRDLLSRNGSLETRKSFDNGLTLSFKLEAQDKKSINVQTDNEEALGGTFQMNRHITPQIYLSSSYSIHDVNQILEDFFRQRLNLQLVLSALESRLKFTSDFLFSEEKRQTRVDEKEWSMQIDYRLNDNTEISTQMRRVIASQDAEGGNGFAATQIKSEVVIRF